MKYNKLVIIDNKFWIFSEICTKSISWYLIIWKIPKLDIAMRILLSKITTESNSRNTKFRSTNFREKLAIQLKSRSTNDRENFAIQWESRSIIFQKICRFRRFLNRQISWKIWGFIRHFRKNSAFWHTYVVDWIKSDYKCRVSDMGAHFFDRCPIS